MKQKLKSHSGMSLAETLVAVIILLLVSTIVMRGVPVAKNAYEKVVVAANAKVMLSTAITSLRNELATAQRIKVGGSSLTNVYDETTGQINKSTGDVITYYSADRGTNSRIYLGDNDVIMLQEFVDYGSASAVTDDTAFFNTLYADWKPKSVPARELTVSLEAQRGRANDKLYVQCESIAHDMKNKRIEVKGLKVCRSTDDTILAQYGKSDDDDVFFIRVIPNDATFAPEGTVAGA